MSHPALSPGRVALVTGAARGIGRAAARRFAALGMRVCLTDIDADALEAARTDAAAAAPGGSDHVMALRTDVGDRKEVEALAAAVLGSMGEVGVLMNNAVSRIGGGIHGDPDDWRRTMDVNFWGIVDCVRALLPSMTAMDRPGLVINAGSKQGITNPPGNTAYNITKSAVKTYTEALEHELRNTDGCKVSAHLLVPGWTREGAEEQARGAWRPDQVVDFMLDALAKGSFYIICPDGETTPDMDAKRILWSAGDIVEDRAALSRWHPEYGPAFDRFGD